MLPNPDVLAGIEVGGVSISNLLERINKRIEVLYDREHTIGHSYFMALKKDPSIDALARIFENNIIPLLQEYFYEDYEKIRLVLGDSKKADKDTMFIIAEQNDYSALFGNVDIGLDDGYSYKINKKAFTNIEAYKSI
jgi:5-methylcytosine-specific restriction protein B